MDPRRRLTRLARLGARCAVMPAHHQHRATRPAGLVSRPQGPHSRLLAASSALDDAPTSSAGALLSRSRECGSYGVPAGLVSRPQGPHSRLLAASSALTRRCPHIVGGRSPIEKPGMRIVWGPSVRFHPLVAPRHDIAQGGHRIPQIDEPQIQRAEAEAENIRRAKIADHAAIDQGGNDRGAVGVGQ